MTSKLNKKRTLYLIILSGFLSSIVFAFGSFTIPGDVVEEYLFNKEGNLISRTAPDGSGIKYKYNNKGLLVEIDYPDGSVKYDYDTNGNRIQMLDRSGKIEYRYDAFNRLIEVVFNHSPIKKVRYEYDPWSRIISIAILNEIDNTEFSIKYNYDILGNIINIDDGIGRIEYNYFPEKGEIVRQLPNGIKTVFSYSPAGELNSLRHSDSQNGLLASYRYEYNPPGKISSVFEETSEGTRITKFEWDSRGNLKTLNLPDGKSIHYEYDSMGNRKSMIDANGGIVSSYRYGNFGRLIQAGETIYKWDKNGNIILQIEKDKTTEFKYDSRNLLGLVRTPDSLTRYSWDGDGNMIAQWKGKEPTYYLPNPLAPSGFTLAEFDKTGKINVAYLYGDTLIGQRDVNGRMKYFLEDGFNSIRHITDTNGKIIGQQDYLPFAEIISAKGDTIPFRMAGERFLPEIKSYALGGNLYSPRVGMLNQSHIPIGYRPQDYGDPVYERARKLFDMGQRLPLPPKHEIEAHDRYWNEGSYWELDPYYQDLKNLDRVASLTPGNYLKSIWQNLRSSPIGREKSDWPLNFVGRVFNLNWFGRNVTGGQSYVYTLDERNQFPLGNTTIPGRNSLDEAARKHDIQYYINTHFDEGTWVQVPGPKVGEYEYFQSRGWGFWKSGLTNAIVIWDVIVSFVNWGAHHGGRTSLPPGQTAVPLMGDSLKSNDMLSGQPHEKPEHGNRLDDKFNDIWRKWFPPPPGCPFCGPDGGGGGPGGSSGGGFNDPFKSIEAKLGGIKLDATAQFTGNLGNIAGAVYDPEKQVLVLVGDEDISLPSIKPEDLAVALMAVFGPMPQDPQFSLDPADPSNPRGRWLRAVYIPEQIIGGTEFGKTLFEADWLLKQYSFGVRFDENNRLQERKSSVSGFKSTAELSLEEKDRGDGEERWNRFWIVSDEMKLKQTGKSIYFDVAKMGVKSRKIVPDPSSPQGFRDVETEDDPIATKFKNMFTELYDEIAKESPEFERVRQLAKAVAIAKWMKQEGIQFDTNWVNEHANKRIDTVGRITALSTQWERTIQTPFQRGNQTGIQTTIQSLHLFGGVDLTVKPKYKSDDGTVQSLQKAVMTKLREKIVEPAFNINHNGKPLKAVVLPITQRGQELWNFPVTTINGTKYQFNNQRDVVKSINADGDVTEYTWDANHRLIGFNIPTTNRWKIWGNRKNGSSEVTITNPLKNNFLYRYSPLGYLNSVFVNGQKYAAVDYKEGDVTVVYSNFVERVKYDNSGRIRRYEIYPHINGSPSGKTQFLYLDYNKEGSLTEVSSPVTDHVRFGHSNGKIKTISTSRGRIDYSYEIQTGNVAQIDTTWGESLRYDYSGDNLTKISYQNGDYQKDIIFANDMPIEIKGSNVESSKYKYTSTGFLEEVTDSTGVSRHYSYNSQNKLRQLILPDSSTMNLLYEYYSSKDSEEKPLKKLKIIHAATEATSSPVTERKADSATIAVAKRLEDIKDASKNLKNGLIIDLFIDESDDAHGNIIDSSGNLRKIDNDVSKELRKLLNITAKTQGKLGQKVLEKWDKFYNGNLASLVKPVSRTSPDGNKVKLKPLLIIKSNDANYKYANLEKVPVLADNFIIFIASKNREANDVSETSSKDLVAKINNIPKLTKDNVAFIIRLPDMSKGEQEEWSKEINNLQELIGKDNILVDPTKEELEAMLRNRGKDIIAIELTHTDKGILLKNGERYTSDNIKQGTDLSHIKYLISGIGTCNLPQLEEGKFATALREKGVGIINGSYREVSSKVALEKLSELSSILRDIKEYDLYPYYLIDIINQRLGITDQGTTNLGKIELHSDYLPA